jgi:hypothetical protein
MCIHRWTYIARQFTCDRLRHSSIAGICVVRSTLRNHMSCFLESGKDYVTALSCFLSIVRPKPKYDPLPYELRSAVDRDSKLPVSAPLPPQMVVGIVELRCRALYRAGEAKW